MLVVDGVPDDAASRARVTETFASQRAVCVAPHCELLAASIGDVFGASGFDAVLSRSPGASSVATNGGGARTVLVKRSLTTFELYGFVTGQEGDLSTSRALPLTVGPRMPAGAQSFVLSDECASVVERTITEHGQWWPYLHGAFSRTCGVQPSTRHVFATAVSSVPAFADGYARARYVFDRNTRALLSVSVTFEPWK